MTSTTHNLDYADDNYLQIMADWMQTVKEATYEKMHIKYGQHILDVGCGPATDTLTLAKMVGPQGRVVGIDTDAVMVRVANERAQEAEVGDYVNHMVANAESLPYRDETFHACLSEQLFPYLRNPQQVMTEMVAVTKAGGWVVTADVDWSAASIDIPYTDFEWKLRRLLVEKSRNGTAARQLYRLMRLAGIETVETQMVYLPITSYDFWRLLVDFDEGLVPRALESGQMTEDEYQQLHKLLSEHDRQGLFFAYTSVLIVAGQKPQE